MRRAVIVFVALFLLGAALRAVNVWRPVDTASWRESDIASIARNYYRENPDLFHPRIDWRGDGPGDVEMEFPLFPWLIAALYRLVGYHESAGRFLSYAFALAAMFVFFRLAQFLLPPLGAVAASFFLAVHPLAIGISYSLQPDGLMFLAYVTAAYAFLRWLQSGGPGDYAVAAAAAALAILAKASAAHIGVFFAALLLRAKRHTFLREPAVWLFGVIALLPAVLWYSYAHQFWLRYGNSLGLSNEYHWAGWDLFTDPRFVTGVLRIEAMHVWMPVGLFLGATALWFRRGTRAVSHALYWLLAAGLFYLVAARTMADDWAVYYHVVSVPAVALLAGAGVEALHARWDRRSVAMPAIVGAAVAASTFAAFALSSAGHAPSATEKATMLLWLPVLAGLVAFGRPLQAWMQSDPGTPSRAKLLWIAAVIVAATLPFPSAAIRPARESALHACAVEFARVVPPERLIVVAAANCRDEKGYPIAYNAPYLFYWMDRKGWNLCLQEQGLERLESLAARGARYFVVEKTILRKRPELEARLRERLPIRSECGDAVLFELK